MQSVALFASVGWSWWSFFAGLALGMMMRVNFRWRLTTRGRDGNLVRREGGIGSRPRES
jgi:hypothetical protein